VVDVVSYFKCSKSNEFMWRLLEGGVKEGGDDMRSELQ